MVLGLFGRLVFLCAEGHVLTPHAFSREVSARWARHDILGAMPVHEWTGENPDEISLDIMLNASLGVPPDTALAVLRSMHRQKDAQMLFLGARYLGNFLLQSWSESCRHFNGAGAPLLVEASLKLVQAERGLF